MQFSEFVESHYTTSEAAPFIVEGETTDGRYFHFLYRHGWATLKVGTSQRDLTRGTGVSTEPKCELPGWMNRTQFEAAFVDMYYLHNQKYVLQSSTED